MKGAPFVLVRVIRGFGVLGVFRELEKNRSNQLMLNAPIILFLAKAEDFANPKHYGCAEDADEPIVH